MMLSREQVEELGDFLCEENLSQTAEKLLAHDNALRERVQELERSVELDQAAYAIQGKLHQQVQDLTAHLATLTTAHQQVEEERNIAERALTAKGYRKQCDIMACNCGPQWHHGGHAEQRLSEIAEALPWENGKTVRQRVTDLQAQHQQAVNDVKSEQAENRALRVEHGKEASKAIDLQASLQQAVEVLAGVRNTLFQHWITAIDCNHEAKTDTVRCACSIWTGTEQPCVGDAVKEWIAHVFEQAALHGTGVSQINAQSVRRTPHPAHDWCKGIPFPKPKQGEAGHE